MVIEGVKLGKRFNRDWIFKDLDLRIAAREKVAIIGRNGAGKSTLLKVIGNYLPHTKGEVKYLSDETAFDTDEVQLHINFAAPYLNVPEEFTLDELLAFHSNFKRPITDIDQLLIDSDLFSSKGKYIKDFSSGMKQRVKLILAFGFQSKIILLDEPSSNLDSAGILWFKNLVRNHCHDRSVIIASNLEEEIELCSRSIKVKNS